MKVIPMTPMIVPLVLLLLVLVASRYATDSRDGRDWLWSATEGRRQVPPRTVGPTVRGDAARLAGALVLVAQWARRVPSSLLRQRSQIRDAGMSVRAGARQHADMPAPRCC
jgi:hypothetical protein